ncbi:LysR family transcriptional regulator [Paraburkholderia caribensis]|uniref:Transcriptional regulator n=1 Tax=Paraburkholderia caribensis TaxID=75105 RepID=A0A9Q6WR30_9BURK|nr:LysR family transcriptional regulator [Paraburkholderia caribensis]MCO4877373.1 LysR family transcriptional regulator [Paraburkholderia caribensis]PTB29894.1 transcriptional regulator [Paraburkholderia caribensis]QLB67216.1 transcriptional regulator [Paraburkholderia caribensis]
MDRLAAIEIFIRVVDTGSFSAAARHFDIGQPAASKAVAQLEEWLGVKLLLRSTRALTPTEAGQNFYQRARRAVEEADEAVLAARGTAAGLTGKLRVSAAVCFARLHIVPRLPVFLEQHPDLDLELVLDDRNIDLVEEGIDLALRMGELADSNMTARRIAVARRRVLATPAYLERHGMPQAPADLHAHRAVVYTRDVGGGEEWTFRRDTAELPVRLQGRVRISATEGLRAAVFADMGLAVASEWAFWPELQSGAVVSVMDDWTLPAISLSAVYPTGRQASSKARQFTAFVEECLAPEFASERLFQGGTGR